MRGNHSLGLRSLLRDCACAALLAQWLVPAGAIAQQKDDYLLGEENRLEMVVHVLGEVARPGEYRVADDTNVLELLSKAGGGTGTARLSEVTITRLGGVGEPSALGGAGSTNGSDPAAQRVFRVNIEDILQGKTAEVPLLHPGDVVMVPRNSWAAWRTTAAVLRDLSIVATTYFIGVRAFNE